MKSIKIVLTGNAGSGKSTVGKMLAERLGVDFLSIGDICRKKAVSLGMDINQFQEYLKSNHVPYNPDIAATFFKAGLIEAWGRGTIKMLNECKQAKLPAPVFTYETSGLTVGFKNSKLKPSGQTIQESSVKSSVKIVDAMSKNKEITIPELAELIGVTTRAIEKQIEKLKKTKKIRRVGADKGGYWEILNAG
jgi:ATP-dependent DNA helicase RecG